MKRDPKLNPFDPRNPEYWFRKRLIGVTKVDYSNGYNSTPGNWGYNQYLFEPQAASLVSPKLIKEWNERTYETKFDPHPAEEELGFICNEELNVPGVDEQLILSVMSDGDTDQDIIRKIKETKNMVNNKIIH